MFGANISVMSGSELCLPDVDMQAVPIQDADRDRGEKLNELGRATT